MPDTDPDVLLRVDDVVKHFPIRQGIFFKRQIGATFQQIPDMVGVDASAGGEHQRRVAFVIRFINVGPMTEQK